MALLIDVASGIVAYHSSVSRAPTMCVSSCGNSLVGYLKTLNPMLGHDFLSVLSTTFFSLFANHSSIKPCLSLHLSHITRKPVYAICEQQRHRSADAQSLISIFVVRCLDSVMCNTSTCYRQNLKTLASLCS